MIKDLLTNMTNLNMLLLFKVASAGALAYWTMSKRTNLRRRPKRLNKKGLKRLRQGLANG